MHAEEYLRIATGDIADPARACDAYRELKGHLEEAAAEVVSKGIDPATAQQVAMARMGAPENLAFALAVAHHRHIAWRHYLAFLPLAGLIASVLFWVPGAQLMVPWCFALLLFCLAPSGATLRKLFRMVHVDLQAKWHWLQEQPLQRALIAGGSAGIVAGLIWSLLPLWNTGGIVTILLIPLASSLAVALLLRRLQAAPAMLTACFAASAFPAGSLPGVFVWRIDPLIWLFFSALFVLLVLAAGWIAHTLQRKGWLPRT